jgi:hypothetical protein
MSETHSDRSTRKIFIDSSLRDYGQTYDFTVSLREPIHNVKGIRLAEADIVNSFYNVNNISISITDGGGTDIITPANGYYAISALLTAIQTAANASGTLTETYTFSYNSVSGKVSVSATGNFTMSGALAEKLGFVLPLISASSFTASRIADLRPTKNIYIAILNLPVYSNFNSIVNGVLGKVSNNDVFLSTLTTDIDYEMVSLRNVNSIDSIQFVLFGDDGTVLDNNGVDWTATLEIEMV